MDVKWEQFGVKAYHGIKDAGAVCTIHCFTTEDDDYDITTGNIIATETIYSSHAIIKNYKSDAGQIINYENVEIMFHSGSTPDTIPDLTNVEKIQITTQSKLFDVIDLQVVRPAGITMMYKAKARENSDA